MAKDRRPHPLSVAQTGEVAFAIGERVRLRATASITPAGLLAAGGLVAAILLAVPPIVLAARRRARQPAIARLADRERA